MKLVSNECVSIIDYVIFSLAGIFNISMIVTNEYGRSTTNVNLYRLSGTGDLYTFQTYARMYSYCISHFLFVDFLL